VDIEVDAPAIARLQLQATEIEAVSDSRHTPQGSQRRRALLADFQLFATGEAVAAALHGCGELLEVDLEGVEDVVGVVLRAETDLALTRAGLLIKRACSSRASLRIRSASRFASASISWRSFTIQRACLISSGIVARIWSRMS
jgi:hypothetical protein